MAELSRHEHAFVRPSPSSGILGGVAQYTHDVIQLCQSAGYGTVIVETVGLGQSEILIDQAVDVVTLVIPPAGGDELQGVKKGIIEVSHEWLCAVTSRESRVAREDWGFSTPHTPPPLTPRPSRLPPP